MHFRHFVSSFVVTAAGMTFHISDVEGQRNACFLGGCLATDTQEEIRNSNAFSATTTNAQIYGIILEVNSADFAFITMLCNRI